MKRNGAFATLSALCFLLAGVSPAYNISALLRAGIPSPNVCITGLQLVCLVLMALHLLTGRPLNAVFTLYPVIYFLMMLFRIFIFGYGNLTVIAALNILAWMAMAWGCVRPVGNRRGLSAGKKLLLFLAAILSGAAFVMNQGIRGLEVTIRFFDPGKLLAWARLSPIALVAAFLFFALWAAADAAADPGVETAPAPAPNKRTRDEDLIAKQYRSFLESGIITRAEYDAKMRNLRK